MHIGAIFLSALDARTLIPAIAAALFVLFLLWKMRPAGFGARRPLDPRIAEVRARAARSKGNERAVALCEAGDLSVEAHRPTAAFGYYLRAARADVAAIAPIVGFARALSRKPRALERVLLRHLSTIDWRDGHNPAVRAALDELASVYRRTRERARAQVIDKTIALLPPKDA